MIQFINIAYAAACPGYPQTTSATNCMTTSTLAGYINQLGTLLGDYFQVLISNFWPILLGIVILTGVVGLVYWGIRRLFHH